MRDHRGAFALRAAACAALLAWAAGSTALAQPYAADGGFDRPWRVAGGQVRPVATLTLDRGVATLVRVDEGVLVAQPLDGGAPRRLDEADGVRWVVADGALDRPLVAVWSRRDPTTGRYVFGWSEGGELLRTVQPLEPVPVAAAAGPVVLVARGLGADAVIERLEPGGTTAVLHRTELRLAALSAAAGDDDAVHLTWLEGRTEASAFGTRADWTVRAATWRPSEGTLVPVDLGPAPDGFAPTTTTWDAGAVRRTWVDRDGVVQVTTGDVAVAATTEIAAAAGRPVAAFANAVFGSAEGTVWRTTAAGSVPVAWSPLVIAQAWAVHDRAGVTHLAWVGTETGGQHALYAADDRRPMARTWRDHLAARLGWSPWNLAEEAAGQAAGSALVAVLMAMAAAPLLWLLAIPFAGRGSARRARWRGALLGAALGPALVAAAIAGGVAAATLAPLIGGWTTLATATLVAALVGVLAWSRRDLEPAPAFVAAGVTAVAVATAVVAFVAFQRWLALTLV